jgi:hypothetical protein
VIVGPVAFVWLVDAASIPAHSLGDDERGYVARKVLVLVQRGRTQEVSVASGDRPEVSLLYDPSAFDPSGRYAFDAGAPVVRFEACPGTKITWTAATQFNGGILAKGPVCLHLIVRSSVAASERAEVPITSKASCPT